MANQNSNTRFRNTARSSVFGLINKIINLIIPFVVRTIFIRVLGIDYLGLNSLFSSILNVLNLAELGIDSAVVFMLYKPLACSNEKDIDAILLFLKKAYYIIGGILVVLGLIVIPLFPYLVSGSYPQDINIYIVYLIQLLNMTIPYFLFSYRRALLQADQRADVNSNIGSVVTLFQYGCQIVFLLLFKNYYYYIAIPCITTFISEVFTYYITRKMYPSLKPLGKISKEDSNAIFSKVKALFLYRLGSVVLVSADSIVISAKMGLYELGRYNSYYYVISALFGLISVLTGALTSSVGNSIVSEPVEKNAAIFNRLFFMLSWFIAWCTTCLLCLYQPFIGLWIGAAYFYPFGVIVSLSIYFYVWKMMEVVNIYKDAAGLWTYDKYRPLIAAIINLTLNFVLVNYIGIYGIIWSTIFSIVFIIFPWSTAVIFKHYFKKGLGL
jgi:O-antigen/teichoic acid export membrane protein